MRWSDGERYREYARKITHETMKFEAHGKLRMERTKADPEKWLRLDTISAKRFVLKITKMVEGFE